MLPETGNTDISPGSVRLGSEIEGRGDSRDNFGIGRQLNFPPEFVVVVSGSSENEFDDIFIVLRFAEKVQIEN